MTAKAAVAILEALHWAPVSANQGGWWGQCLACRSILRILEGDGGRAIFECQGGCSHAKAERAFAEAERRRAEKAGPRRVGAPNPRRALADSVRALSSFEELEKVRAQHVVREALQGDRPLDGLLEGLRAVGEDQYRGDPHDPHRWHSYCPACASELVPVRSLLIRELPSGRVMFDCWRRCSEAQIVGAIKLAERNWTPPPGLAMAERELAELGEARAVIWRLREAGHGHD
jgi:hypothetical protein